MKRDLRAVASLVAFVASQITMMLAIKISRERMLDWAVNGDPCDQARARGGHFGFCEPLVPKAETYLALTWLALAILAAGLLLWIFWKPLKQ